MNGISPPFWYVLLFQQFIIFSAVECLVVVLAQLVFTVFTVFILQFSNRTGVLVLPPIEYTSSADGGGNPWIVVRTCL